MGDQLTKLSQRSGAVDTKMLPGQFRIFGSSVSSTVIWKLQLTCWPPRSVTVQVTVVSPSGKVIPIRVLPPPRKSCVEETMPQSSAGLTSRFMSATV